jgi:acylphosphatase
LKDGTVELVIEGDREEVAQFIASVQERMGGLIKETIITMELANGGFAEFNVLY